MNSPSGHRKILHNECIAVPRSGIAQCDERTPAEEAESARNTVRQGAWNPDPSRRRFLRNTTMGTIAALGSSLGMEFVLPSSVLAQNLSSPDAALQELIAGNQRFT